MSWDRTCCMSTASSSTGSGSSSTFSPSSLTRDYDIPPPPPSSSSSSSSSFFFFSSSDYIDEQSTREREENNSLPPPPPSSSSLPPIYNYHPHIYSPVFASRANVSDICSCNSTNTQIPPYDISSSFQSPFLYEQYLTSLKSEQSDHLPYLFDNIIYPQPCSPPSPTNDSITYYQLDHANTTTIINKFPQRSHVQTIQPITYQQLSLVEPPSSKIQQQKLPIVKRFYYDSNMSNTTTTTILTTTTSIVTNTNDNDHINLPYARLDSIYFGTYDIWQERTIVGRKNNRREVDVNMGSTSVVSRIHFELLLVDNIEFHLKCLSKNGIFINNNYAKMFSTTVLPKQCTLRFPSTDLCISFSSLLNTNNNNNSSISRPSTESISSQISSDTIQQRLSSSSSMDTTPLVSLQSVPSIKTEQQVILVSDNHQIEGLIKEENLPPLSINISNSLSSELSFSAGSNIEQRSFQHESSTGNNHSFLGSSISSCSTSPKTEPNESQPIINSPNIQRIPSNGNDYSQQEHDNNSKNGIKPPFSYAQLIVQAILSAPDKQMTLSQIYSFISAQYPYYEANNRGWQNSIRHNLSLNRYFIRLARKENESGKGSFWRLDQTCEEKLIDHAFRHRKQRTNSNHILINSNIKHESEEIHSPIIQYCNDQTDFLLADIQTSNSSTSLSSSLTSPLNEDYKRKREDLINYEIEILLNSLIDSIHNDKTVKRQKI
ncbi:unnamed protein product [Adineta steineri]|uniref:Uncharacterized protein n=1 Tax=Adineta steineri TaxID=433720 RepID=A0A815ACX8_9BILA|nr:unnamed protein product [Adineta steineri]CAF3739676.1 unnamed protein product [Adineta steineri]